MKKLICKCGLRKNGTAWYMVDGKFVNKSTFNAAYYATDREEADIAATGAVITPATVCKPTRNYDISSTLLWVVGVVVLVFVMAVLGLDCRNCYTLLHFVTLSGAGCQAGVR